MNATQKKKWDELYKKMDKLSKTHDNIWMDWIDGYDAITDLWIGYMENLEGDKADSELEELEEFLKDYEDKDLKESRRPSRRGSVLTEATRDYWHGIRGARFVYHGDWGDPEIIYKGTSLNYYDVDEAAYDVYKDEHPKPEDVSEREYVEEYEEWLDTKEGKETLKGILFDLT